MLKLKKKDIIEWFVLIGIIITLMLGLIYYIIQLPYESKYFEKVGINRYHYLYSDMLNDFGKPKNILVDDNYTEFTYENFIMFFWDNKPNSELKSIRIISDKYRFGVKSIGIGSKRNEVENAYRFVRKSPDSPYTYIDGGIYVKYIFSEEDIVCEIMFFDYNQF